MPTMKRLHANNIKAPSKGDRWSATSGAFRGLPGNLTRFVPSGKRLCVMLDGYEVSNRCFYANETQGIIGLFAVNEFGQMYANESGDQACEWLWGRVAITEVRV